MAAFLTALVVCPLVGLNAWPFSSWELFSRLRADRQTAWTAEAVTGSGASRAVPTASLPGFGRFVAGFSGSTALNRDATCAAWVRDASDQSGERLRRLSIDRLQWRLSDRRGDRAAAPHRTVIVTCDARGAHSSA